MAEEQPMLLICDDVDVSKLIKLYFLAKHYEVHMAPDFIEGLLAAAHLQPQLIFLALDRPLNLKRCTYMLKKVAPGAEIKDSIS